METLLSLRALGLASLIAAAAAVSAAAQAPRPDEAPLELAFVGGIGIETETAEGATLVARELLTALAGRLSGSADLSSAFGVAQGSDSALLDSAGLHVAYRLLGEEGAGLALDSHARYRDLFYDSWELRLGFELRGTWGARRENRGLFGDWAVGFEGIRSTFGGLPSALWQGNPLLRADIGWRLPSGSSLDVAVATFSDEDASYAFRTFFDFGSSIALARRAGAGASASATANAGAGGATLRCRLVVKYSDFATPTGYIDGFAFRVALAIPLSAGGST